MFASIVVGTDGSQTAREAVRQAVQALAPEVLFFGATGQGRDLAPRAADRSSVSEMLLARNASGCAMT